MAQFTFGPSPALTLGRKPFAHGKGGGRVAASALMTSTFRMSSLTNVNSGTTYAQAWAVESPFDYVRAIMANDYLASYEIEGLAFAPSAKRNDDALPITAADAAIPFVRATFGNGGAFTALADQPASPSAQTLVVPGVLDTNDSPNPVIVASDWVACSSIDRADAGQTLPLLFTRYKNNAATTGRGVQGIAADDYTNAAKWPAVSQGRMIRCQRRASNWFTNGNLWTGTLAEQALLPILGIQTMSRVAGITVMTLGDSLVEGRTTVINANSFGHQACCLVSTPAKPVTHIAGGWAGQTYANTYERGMRQIDLFRPSILMLFAVSLNGGSNDPAKFAAMKVQFDTLVGYAKARNVRVIAVTYPPYNLAEPTDLLVRGSNDELRFRAAAGEFGLCDYDARVCIRDGSGNVVFPRRMIAEFLGSDFAHTGDLGHIAVAIDCAAPAIAAVI